jgi:hypothetical protein
MEVKNIKCEMANDGTMNMSYTINLDYRVDYFSVIINPIRYAIKIYDYPSKGKSQWFCMTSDITTDLNKAFGQLDYWAVGYPEHKFQVEEYNEKETK